MGKRSRAAIFQDEARTAQESIDARRDAEIETLQGLARMVGARGKIQSIAAAHEATQIDRARPAREAAVRRHRERAKTLTEAADVLVAIANERVVDRQAEMRQRDVQRDRIARHKELVRKAGGDAQAVVDAVRSTE